MEVAVNLFPCLKHRHDGEDWKPKWITEGDFVWLTALDISCHVMIGWYLLSA